MQYDVFRAGEWTRNLTSQQAADLAQVDRADMEWAIDEYGRCDVGTNTVVIARPTDVCDTRAQARSIAAQLRDRGWNASVERSGPKGNPEYRVYVFSGADPDLVAYYQIGDSIEFFNPYWIDRR